MTHTPATRDARRQGFTLMELLVVCAILAVLMGVGAAFVGSLDRSQVLRAEKGRIDALIRQARNFAASEHAQAWLILDPADNTVEVKAMTTVGQWHFEDEDGTGYTLGDDIQITGARLSDPELNESGKIGRCLIFDGGRSGVDLGNGDLFNSPHGISVEAWVFPYDRGRCTLFKKGKGLSLSVVGGYLEGMVRGVATVNSKERKRTLTPGRWTHVAMIFDGRKLRLLMNGSLADEFPKPSKKKKSGKTSDRDDKVYKYDADEKDPLDLGLRFNGRIDEVRVMAVVHPEVQELDPNVEIDMGRTSVTEIHFSPGGWLDEAFHDSDLRVTIMRRNDPERFETIEISRMGTIR